MMWQALGMLAAVYGWLALLLTIFQSNLVFYPEAGREIIATPVSIGLSYEDLQLHTADGINLHGWYIPAPQPRGTVLFLHGNAGIISHRLDSVQMFHRLGYNTLIFDYRGYGNSGGTPSEEGSYRDAGAAWLAARENPAALVITSGFTSVADLGQQLNPFLPVRWLARIRYDTRAYLGAVTAPVLVAHSPDDEIIPYKHGQALFAAARPPRQFLELAGGHNDGFIFMRATWVKALGDFLAGQTDTRCG